MASEEGDIMEWSVAQVVQWLNRVGLEKVSERFAAEDINGGAMMTLSEAELKEDLKLNLGQKKTFLLERQKLQKPDKGKAPASGSLSLAVEKGKSSTERAKAQVEASSSSSTTTSLTSGLTASEERRERIIPFVLHPVPSHVGEGLTLPKGFLPVARPLTMKERESIRKMHIDPATKKRVPWDEPLSDSELACWEEQLAWLKCPISKKDWYYSILPLANSSLPLICFSFF